MKRVVYASEDEQAKEGLRGYNDYYYDTVSGKIVVNKQQAGYIYIGRFLSWQEAKDCWNECS